MDDDLKVAIACARRCLETDSDSDIRPGYIDGVFLALCEAGQAVPVTLRHPERQFAVELNSGKHILPIWEASQSSRLPHRYLHEADRFLRGDFSPTHAEQVLEDCQEEFERLESVTDFPVATISQELLLMALAQHRRPIGRYIRQDTALPLSAIDADEWHISSLSANVYSGGAPWTPCASKVRRREFWEWWLDSNVPSIADR
jgi:hypothetical protein